MAVSKALAFVSGLEMDRHRLKSLSGADVRYLISYFLRKMNLMVWIVVNISFSSSATTAVVNKLPPLTRSILWYCTWFLIRLHFSVEGSRVGPWVAMASWLYAGPACSATGMFCTVVAQVSMSAWQRPSEHPDIAGTNAGLWQGGWPLLPVVIKQ